MMRTMERPSILQHTSDAQYHDFLMGCHVLNVTKPRLILRQGDPAPHAFIVIRGTVEISFVDVDGNRILAHVTRPGDVMGDVEVFSDRACAASCIAQPDSVLAMFDGAHMLRTIPAQTLLRNLAGIFHDRLCRDNRQQSVAMNYAAEDRVRITLLTLTTDDQPKASIAQTGLADYAGCSRQTVNRTLAELRIEGIVDIARGSIRVLDRQRLQNRHIIPAGLA